MRVELAWVDALLSRWGRWAIRCESGALGFSSSCILGGGSGDGYGYGSAPPLGTSNDDMEAVDGAIRKLPKVLRLTILEVYKFGHGQSDRAISASLGVHVDTMRKYVLEAHRKIAVDIALPCAHNPLHSANRGSCLEKKQPATA